MNNNPFLRGWNTAQAMSDRQGILGLQQAQGILSLQNALRQQQDAQEQAQSIAGIIPQLTDPAAQMLARTGDIRGAITRQFPQPKSPIAVSPGTTLVNPDAPSVPLFTAPKEPETQVDASGVLRYRTGPQIGQVVPGFGNPKAPEGMRFNAEGKPEAIPEWLNMKRDLARAGRSNVVTNVLPPQKTFENEDKLRADYSSNPVVKASSEMQNAFNLIEAAYKRPSAANDLAMATKYMKILDPTSVVRESEFALAVNATGLLDKVQNYAASVLEGKKLNPKQREDFYKSAKAINDAFQSQRADVDRQFAEMASEYGLNPKNVIPSLRRRKTDNPANNTDQPAPQGVAPELWNAMTPEERSLWQN